MIVLLYFLNDNGAVFEKAPMSQNKKRSYRKRPAADAERQPSEELNVSVEEIMEYRKVKRRTGGLSTDELMRCPPSPSIPLPADMDKFGLQSNINL